jgi:hypothetical protein
MARSIIHLKEQFTIQPFVNLFATSQIFATHLHTIQKWNKYIARKLLEHDYANLVVHISPWSDDDWQQYLTPGNNVSKMVIWLSDAMPDVQPTHDKIQIVRYSASIEMERFVVVTANGFARALVSWQGLSDDDEADMPVGVFMTDPKTIKCVAQALDQKLSQR